MSEKDRQALLFFAGLFTGAGVDETIRDPHSLIAVLLVVAGIIIGLYADKILRATP